MGVDVDTDDGDETEAEVDGLPRFPHALVSRVPASVAAASHSALALAKLSASYIVVNPPK